MATKEPIGSPIAGTIKAQIEQRQKFLGSTNRNKFVIAYNNGNTAFAILRSSVDAAGYDASSYELGSKYAGGINKSSGATNAYNLSSTTGIRPKPGITSVRVASKGTYGTLLLAEVGFKVFSKEDLDAVEKLYFRPGYTAILEYGHTIFVDNEGTVINMSSGNTIGSKFYSSTPINTIEENIEGKVTSTNHNYEALFGFIQNFSWSLAEDGSYDCSIKLVSKNHVLESIKSPNVSAVVKGGEIEVEEETPIEGYADLVTFIMDRLERQISKTNFDGKAFLQDKSKTGGNVSSVAAKLKGFNVSRTKISLDGTGFFGTNFFNDTINLCYIRLGTLLDMLNTFCVLKGKDSKPIVDFYTEEGEKFNTFPTHFSSNPEIAVPPGIPQGSDRYIKRKGEKKGKSVHEYLQQEANSYGGTDEILNIMVTTQFIKSTMAGVTNGSQEDGTGVMDFMKNLLAGIETAFGSVNNFIIHFDGTQHRIIDSGNKRIPKADAPVIQITGLKSTIYNVSIGSKLTNKIGSQIAIAAGGAQKSYKDNVANLIEFNQGAVDRHLGEISQTVEDKDEAAKNNAELQKKIDDVWKEFNEQDTFPPSKWLNFQGESRSSTISEFEKYRGKKPSIGSVPVPIDLTLTMMGIGGLKNGTVFRIPTKLLPAGYDGFGFIITGVDHNIGGDNKWTTTIKGTMYKLG